MEKLKILKNLGKILKKEEIIIKLFFKVGEKEELVIKLFSKENL